MDAIRFSQCFTGFRHFLYGTTETPVAQGVIARKSTSIFNLFIGMGKRRYPSQVVSSPAVPFYSVCNGEGLRLAKDRLDEKNMYYMNPSFDK